MMDLVGTVVQGLEDLRIQQTDQKIEGRIVVRDHGIEGAFPLSQGIEVHIIVIRDGLDLRQVKRRQPHGGADQDGLCCFPGRLFVNLVLPQRYALRVFLFHGAEQHIQRRKVFLIFLFHLGIFQHSHDHGKILLIRRRLLMEHEDDGLEKRCLRLSPERVRLMASLGRGRLDQRVHQLQRVLFVL